MCVKLNKDKSSIDLSSLSENDFKDVDEIYKIIKSYTTAIPSQKQALSAVLSFLRKYEKLSDPRNDSELGKKYCKLIQELSSEINKIRSKNTLSPKEKKLIVLGLR